MTLTDKKGKTVKKIRIKGIDNLSIWDIQERINQGYRFVIFSYAIFWFVLVLKRNSSIHFIDPNKRFNMPKILFSFISIFFFIITVVWFYITIKDPTSLQDMDSITKGILYILMAIGVIFPIPSIITNIRGGEDITEYIVEYLRMQNNLYEKHISK